MVWELQTIDAMARRVGRDVLFLEPDEDGAQWAEDDPFEAIQTWLSNQGIESLPVEIFDPETIWIEGAPMCVFVDVLLGSKEHELLDTAVKPDAAHPAPGTWTLHILPISVAQAHSERDTEEFWDKYI
jgi:hypothetical protein